MTKSRTRNIKNCFKTEISDINKLHDFSLVQFFIISTDDIFTKQDAFTLTSNEIFVATDAFKAVKCV